MDLLPLPPFHHELLFLILALPFVFLFLWLFRRRKRVNINLDDPYAITKALQKLKPSRERNTLLEELKAYKYRPNPPMLPKSLKKRVKKVLQLDKTLRR